MQKIEPKILKGTREFGPEEMAKRSRVMSIIKKTFKKFGYGEIETPILCPAETILGKYGEEGTKLTYNFSQRDTKIALPYDLTVPFARFVAANFRSLPMPFKRYQIQRVWRAEKPQKGRLREFYQLDIDIIGTRSLIAEAEVAKVVVEVFEKLGFEKFTVKVNSRRLLNTILDQFGVKAESKIEIIRVIDKLGKIGEEVVVEELEKSQLKNAKELIELLKSSETNEQTLEKMAMYDTSEIEEFLGYCKALAVPQEYIKFDPSLARGLDYYTGITYEIIDQDGKFGSICGGGRYDDLCGLFCDEDLSGVGVAFGFERIMLALEEMGAFEKSRPGSEVLVTVFDDKTKNDALSIYADLIGAGIKSEIYFEPGNLSKQFKYADKKKVKFIVIRGTEEMGNDTVSIKSMETGKQKTLPRNQLVSYLKNYYDGK